MKQFLSDTLADDINKSTVNMSGKGTGQLRLMSLLQGFQSQSNNATYPCYAYGL